MAGAPGQFSIVSLYASHPHVLTTIMYYCSPTTFDAFRYTCKAIYSMSLDPDLLEYHLKTIVNHEHEIILARPPRFYDTPFMDTKFDTVANAHGNLWRLRGLILQEFLRMQSSWRVGEYKKVVVELDIHPDDEGAGGTEDSFGDGPHFDGTIHLTFGTVRGETLAVSWGDKERTHLHTYSFTNSKKYAIRNVGCPEGTTILHQFSKENKYQQTTFTTKKVGKRGRQGLTLTLDSRFSIAINEGEYKRDPATLARDYYLTWYHPKYKDLACTFLRVKFHGKYSNEVDDVEEVPLDLAYGLDSEQKGRWTVPAMSISNATNIVLSDHAEEDMKLLLGKDGKCTSKGYAIGIDSGPHRKWKVLEPRRLEEDVSRLGVWRDLSVEFKRGTSEEASMLQIVASISKNLVKPDPEKRFLLSNSKISNPSDWVKVQIPLVLPLVTEQFQHGKLLLATVTPAAYFRRRVMSDPEIPSADEGFISYDWNAKKEEEGKTKPAPLLIRTGAMIRGDLVDAEVVVRVVGWTDDGSVWLWDISEKNILDAAERAIQSEKGQLSEITAKKLGYVKDVKGIVVTGDRAVQRVVLVTYGKKQKVHQVGMEGEGENDSGISFLRKEDIIRKIEMAKARKGSTYHENFQSDSQDLDGEGEQIEPELSEAEDCDNDSNKWRMVTYTFGAAGGANSSYYRIDPAGDIEEA